jgi:hypothetical protein
MADTNSQPKRLDEQLFKRPRFLLPWLCILIVVLFYVSWPIRNIALVCWVYGIHGYFHDGIRVLYGNPVRFSNGVEAPRLADFVTGAAAFIITFFGLTMLLMFALRFYERHFRQKDDHVA